MPNFHWLISCLYVLQGVKLLRAVYRFGVFSLLVPAFFLAGGVAQAATLVTVSSYEITPYPAGRGEEMVFTVTATATDAVNNAVMTVGLPSNVDFSGSTAPEGCSWSPASGSRTTLECTKASLAKQAKWEVSFNAKAGDTPSVQTSTASVSAQGSDLHQSPKNVEVIKAANLELKKTGPSTALAGATVSFVLTVRNDGPDAAENLTLTDTLPTDFVLTSMSGTGWSCASATCTIGSLAANASTVVTVTGRITASNGTVRNSASVSMSSQSVRDPNLVNNSDSADVVISPAVDLRANKTMLSTARGGSTFTKGEQVRMTLSATNTGVMKADGVVVEDIVPAGFSNITAANSATQAACSVTGNTIRCDAGSVEGGNTSASYSFTMTAPAVVVPSGSNTATVSNITPVEGTRTPATVTYKVVEDYARLTVGKSKGPASPVKVGQEMTSTISVAYDTASTSVANGTITVVEELSANETYLGVDGGAWSCTGVAEGATGTLTCTHTLASPLSKNNLNAPNLVIRTKATDLPSQDLWDVNNRACMGNTHSPADSSGVAVSCASPLPGIKGTRKQADLKIEKSVSPGNLASTDEKLTYTLTITNNGPDVAPTVKVADTLDAFFKSTAAGGATAVALSGSGASGCTHDGNGTISCNYTNFGVGDGNAKEVSITLTRPFKSGTISNTATVSSPDAFDPVTDNNSATASSTVAAKTDVVVQSISGSPSMVPVGVKTTITTEIKNQGASTAEGTVLYQLLQPAGDEEKMVYVAGSARIVGGNGSCSYVTFAEGPYSGGTGLKCTIGSGGNFPSNTNYQLVFDVLPTYGSTGSGYPDPLTGSCAPQGTGNACAAYQTEASIITTTPESDSNNNKTTGVVKVTAKIINLAVTIQDPGYDPVGLGNPVVYTVTIENRDASRATGVRVRVMPPAASTPAGGRMKYLQSEDSTLTCVPDGIGVVCQLNPTLAQSILEAGQRRELKLRFATEPANSANPPAEVVTFSPVAVVWSFETGGSGSIADSLETAFPGDSVPGNNRELESTTVLPITDLTMLSKSVSKTPVMLNEPFEYVLSLKNKGPSSAKAVVITDTLPLGLQVLLGAYGGQTYALTVQKGGAVTSDFACTPAVVNRSTSISCTVNNVPKDVDVVVKLPVIARDGVYTSAHGFSVDRSNTAKVDVPRDGDGVPTSSLDPNPADNEASVPVQVEKAKITGDVVYAEGDPLTTSSWKAVPSVTVTLSGKDKWGNAINRTVNTGADGKFAFDNLPPSDADGYFVVQTQPAGYWDYLEQGPAGVVLPSTTCDGVINCSSAAAANTIAKVVVSDTAKTVSDLRFQELKAAQVKGWVYEDNNNDAVLDAGENKISVASTVVLAGKAYNGQELSTFVGLTLSQTSNASGYVFSNLPPSNDSGYTVKQTVEPTGYLNGKTSVQPQADAFNTAGQVAAAAGNYGNTIEKIVLHSAGVATGNNFGELKPASLSGYAFIDGNKNAFRDGVDTSGVTGMKVRLTGTDDQGNSVDRTENTGTSGLYTFANLRPGTYEVTITKLSGMTHVGAQIGDKGGQAGGVSGPSVGNGVKDTTEITNIKLMASDQGLNYNFGQSGEGLSGKVYVDLNGNGLLDAGEPGIPDVKISLSGTTKDGRDVCVVISPQPCTTTTGADGGYSFVGLPESNGTGYTLKEQVQSDAPLSRYADGEETVGSLGGSKANDVISGIPLAGIFGSNYNFGEKGIDLPGRVFVDGNGNTTPEAGEPGLPGVSITLTGTTVDGQDVCAVLTSQGRSCTVQTGSDGTFNFPGLPAGNYTLTETQPKDYANSGNKPGNAGGTGNDEPNGDTKITGIVLTPGMPKVSEYLFAEKTGGLSGYVYHDKNGNGTRDAAGDPGIAGVTVTLTGTTEQGEAVTRTATTDANGYYSFAGLLNGTYTVKETQPANWLDGKTSKGLVADSECTACGNSTSNAITSIKFVADKAYTEFNFGEVKGTSISGTVYHDVNEDGQPNTHEGLAGITVTLTGTDDQGNPVNKTTTTGPDGKYSFPDLRPSDSTGYTITETQPADIGDFPSNGGQPGSINGNPGGSSTQPNVITGVVLKSGESGEDYNFRDKASSLSGTVYRDDNDNGLRDSNEPGLPNVTVTLTGTSSSGASVTQMVTTDEKGNYSFVGLPAGTYQVVETQPVGMLDGKETAGTKGGNVENGQFCEAAACNTISNISLGQAENATGYLFGERGGSLSGTVYGDLNNSGTKDANEPGLAGVQVTLSGQTLDGQDICVLRGAAFCTALTDANGNYKFEGVPPGVYQLVKNQNQVNELFSGQYGDGKETAGVVGGVVENRYFGTQTGYNSIQKISLTADSITANAGNIGGYLFGVVPSTNTQNRIPPIVSGYVYMDHSHDRVRDPMNTDGQPGWTVTLVASTGQQICQVLTTAEGFYQFDNLSCPEQYRTTGLPTSADLGGATFSIFFSKDGNVLPSLASSGDKVGDEGAGQITNLTLKNTDVLVEQNLPLDPEGVVYDAVTRKPVSGAVVGITFNGSGVFDPAVHLVGGASFQNQTTGADGRYSFILQNNYPSGEYVLTIQSVPQAYLPGPSAMIPPCVNTLNVTMLPGGIPALMQGQRDAPGLSQTLHNPQTCPASTNGFVNLAPFTPQQQSTQYYLKFNITRGGSSEILNNHIPLDPVLAGGAILVTKTTPKVNVAKGDLVPYTITATNMSGGALANVRVRDMLPPGFRYRKGSATWNGLPVEPEVNGRELTWPNQSFVINEKKTYQLLLMVGAGVGEGEYMNQAWAINSQVSERISNVAQALVRVVPDPTFDCSDLIGKVFDDKNANGYQDQGEQGIPNVRVVTARGLLVTTDADGRFHVACAAIPQADRGSNFVMKLDERTLPSGFRMTTENPRDVRVTRGKMVKLNFGATVHKVMRLEVDARAFAQDGTQLSDQWNSQLEQLLQQLAERPTVLRISYRMTGEAKDVAQQRLNALTQRIQDGYSHQVEQRKNIKQEDNTPPLVIETESFEHNNQGQGAR